MLHKLVHAAVAEAQHGYPSGVESTGRLVHALSTMLRGSPDTQRAFVRMAGLVHRHSSDYPFHSLFSHKLFEMLLTSDQPKLHRKVATLLHDLALEQQEEINWHEIVRVSLSRFRIVKDIHFITGKRFLRAFATTPLHTTRLGRSRQTARFYA